MRLLTCFLLCLCTMAPGISADNGGGITAGTGGGTPLPGCPSLPAPQLEFDVRDLVGLADNDPIAARSNTGTLSTTWDQAQADGAKQPTYEQASDCSGLGSSCMDYDGTEFLSSSSGLTWSGSDVVACAVVRHGKGASVSFHTGFGVGIPLSLSNTAWTARGSSFGVSGHTLTGPDWAVYCIDFNASPALSDFRWSGSASTLSADTGTIPNSSIYYSGTYVNGATHAVGQLAYEAVWDAATGATLTERVDALKCEFGL